MNSSLQKNILDLQFQKYLVIASTSVVITFTYLIGAVIGFLTNQLRLDAPLLLYIFSLFSMFIIGFCIFYFITAVTRLKVIIEEVKNLQL